MQLTELVLCIISTYLLAQLNSDLTDGIGGTNDTFRFGTNNGEYGYIKKAGGADTFFPFNKASKSQTKSQLISLGGYATSNLSITFDQLTQIVGISSLSTGHDYIRTYEISINENVVTITANNSAGGQNSTTYTVTAVGN